MGNANKLPVPYTDFDGSVEEAVVPVHHLTSDYLLKTLAEPVYMDPESRVWGGNSRHHRQMRTVILRQRRLVRRIIAQLQRRGEWTCR